MNVTAVVEKIDDRHYRAAISHPFAMESTGATETDAVEKLREMALAKLRSSQLVEIELRDAGTTSPLFRFAGIWKDHPDMHEYLKSIEEHREEMDNLEHP